MKGDKEHCSGIPATMVRSDHTIVVGAGYGKKEEEEEEEKGAAERQGGCPESQETLSNT